MNLYEGAQDIFMKEHTYLVLHNIALVVLRMSMQKEPAKIFALHFILRE